MKKSIISVGILAAICILMTPASAFAGFFDDGRWYMASDQWTTVSDDPEDRGSLTEQGDNLVWNTANSWTDDYYATKVYASKWNFNLENDFQMYVGYHYDHTGVKSNDNAGVMMGLYSWGEGSEIPEYTFGVIAGNNVFKNFRTGLLASKTIGASEITVGSDYSRSWWTRQGTDGYLYMQYNAEDDRLQLATVDSMGDFMDGASEYTGLRETLGLDDLGVYLGGTSQGAQLLKQDAYLKGFGMNTAPEPVSSTLFLLGGAALVARKKLEKIIKRFKRY